MSSSTVYCVNCNQPGHSRRSHRDCRLNPANMNRSTNETLSSNPNDSRCSTCGERGHSRSTSRLCPQNPNGIRLPMHNIAKQTEALPARHNLGRMNKRCPHCEALMWPEERTTALEFQLCCGLGKYVLPKLRPTPDLIARLLKNNDRRSKEFKRHIRAYNNALGFTSMGVSLDGSVENSNGGAYAFRIHGNIYHMIGSLLPQPGERPCFAQVYVYDASNEISNRHLVANYVDIGTLEELQQLMHQINPYVSDFKTMAQFTRETPESVADISLVFRAEGVPDPRRYNAPTNSTEVGVLILGSGNRQNEDEPRYRDIVIRPQNDGQLFSISEINQSYDPMSYVLLFPFGKPGWHIGTISSRNTKVSAMSFYSFYLKYRNDEHCLHLFGHLFQQYIVDMYAKIEQHRLNFIRHNQSKPRVELYRGLQDAVAHDDTDMGMLGQKIILPSTFIGGPRHMSQLYQDAISIVRRFGKPDYFITFTCNPSWPEICNELLFDQIFVREFFV